MSEPGAAPAHPSGQLRVLLVCSNGGHLAQLVKLAPWWRHHDRAWVTFPKADARALLVGEKVNDAYFPTTRHLGNLLRNLRLARRVLREYRPDVVVSTGAGVALPFFVLARLGKVATVYLEVFDRIDTATLTGRLCGPFTDAFCLQWEEQKSSYPRGVVVGPVYETGIPATGAAPSPSGADAAAPASATETGDPGRPLVFVTAGTDHHRFDRLMNWTERWLTGRRDAGAADVDCVVQHGSSRAPQGARTAELLPQDEVLGLMGRATVVVTQGGPGSIMDCRESGTMPIVVPRRSSLGEHVDDHQVAFTERLSRDGYLLLADTEERFRALLDAAVAAPATVRLPVRGSVEIPETLERFAAEVARAVHTRPR